MRLIWIQMTWMRGTKWCHMRKVGLIMIATLLFFTGSGVVIHASPKVRIPSQQELHAQTAEQRIRELEGILNGNLQMIEPVGKGRAYRYVVQKELVEGIEE